MYSQIDCGTDLLVIVWHGFSHHASLVPFVQCNGTTDLPGPLNRLIYCLTQASLVTSSCYWVKPTRHTSWYDKITDLNYVAVKRLQVVPVNLSCQPLWQWWSLLGPCCGWKLCWLTLVTHTCVTWWVLPTAMFEPPPKWDWCSHCTAVRVSPISILNKLRIAWSWVLNSYPE